MKKIVKYLLCMVMAFSLTGCKQDTKDDSRTVQILCPTGAPSLAFVDEYENITKDGQIDLVDGSDQLVAELSKKDSNYDIIVAPINLGAKLIAANQTEFKIASVLTWGNLYLVGTNSEALKGSGELALFGEGAVPQKIYDTVKLDTSLTPTYYQSATIVQQQLLSGKVNVGMLAEPLASATIGKASQNNISLSIIADLQKDYGEDGYPQAAIFVKDGQNYNELFKAIDEFTNNGYQGLKDDLEKIGIETLSLPSVEITVKSIERQNIHYKKASECTDSIKDFLKLFNIDYNKDMLAS